MRDVPPLLSDRLYLALLLVAAIVGSARLAGAILAEPPLAVDLAAVAQPRAIELAPGIVYEPNPATGAAAWVAELVTAESLAGETQRPSSFRVDANLPAGLRARDADYRASGYDRGHLAAAANHGPRSAATFSLANVVPQKPDVNQGPMKQLEESLRGLVDLRTSLVIVTAPLYELDGPKRFAGRLPVPSAFVKAVLVFEEGRPIEGLAYRIDNAPRAGIQLTTIDQVESAIARDLFSFLPDDVESRLESATATAP